MTRNKLRILKATCIIVVLLIVPLKAFSQSNVSISPAATYPTYFTDQDIMVEQQFEINIDIDGVAGLKGASIVLEYDHHEKTYRTSPSPPFPGFQTTDLLKYIEPPSKGGIWPADGGESDPGSFLDLQAEIDDDSDIHTLTIDMASLKSSVNGPGTLVTLKFEILGPGDGEFRVTSVDLRDGMNNSISASSINGTYKFILGDFASAPISAGPPEGKVDFQDLAPWSLAYWSTPISPYWKRRYDIGPTSTNYVNGVPLLDDIVNFEDLMIFSDNYEISGSMALRGNSGENSTASILSKESKLLADTTIVSLSPERSTIDISDTLSVDILVDSAAVLHGFEIIIDYDENLLEVVSVTEGKLMTGCGYSTFWFVASDSDSVHVNDAILGPADVTGPGQLFRIKFKAKEEGQSDLIFEVIDIRDMTNTTIPTKHINGRISVGSAAVKDEYPRESNLPDEYCLAQNFPNPFNPSTQIEYSLPQKTFVSFKVYNTFGQLIKTLVADVQCPGVKTIFWHGKDDRGMNVASGLYFYTIKTENFYQTKRMLLLK